MGSNQTQEGNHPEMVSFIEVVEAGGGFGTIGKIKGTSINMSLLIEERRKGQMNQWACKDAIPPAHPSPQPYPFDICNVFSFRGVSTNFCFYHPPPRETMQRILLLFFFFSFCTKWHIYIYIFSDKFKWAAYYLPYIDNKTY